MEGPHRGRATPGGTPIGASKGSKVLVQENITPNLYGFVAGGGNKAENIVQVHEAATVVQAAADAKAPADFLEHHFGP